MKALALKTRKLMSPQNHTLAAAGSEPVAHAAPAYVLCKDWADSDRLRWPRFDVIVKSRRDFLGRNRAMRLLIEIIAALLLIVCVTATSAAFAAGKIGRTADGVGCNFWLPQNASPAARCAAIRQQCGGKFWTNYCGDKMLSAAQ